MTGRELQTSHTEYQDEGNYPQLLIIYYIICCIKMWNKYNTRTTALALCHWIAEYVAPVWARSSHADILDPKLNKPWRAITGCLEPTDGTRLSLPVWHIPTRSHLKSRNDFLTSVKPSSCNGDQWTSCA